MRTHPYHVRDGGGLAELRERGLAPRGVREPRVGQHRGDLGVEFPPERRGAALALWGVVGSLAPSFLTCMGGIYSARRVREALPATAVVVLSQYLEPTYALRLLDGKRWGISVGAFTSGGGELGDFEATLNKVRSAIDSTGAIPYTLALADRHAAGQPALRLSGRPHAAGALRVVGLPLLRRQPAGGSPELSREMRSGLQLGQAKCLC